jgi:hypothetical protein
MTCLTILGAVAMEWRSVKSKKPAKDNTGQDAGEVEKGAAAATATETGAATGSAADEGGRGEGA